MLSITFFFTVKRLLLLGYITPLNNSSLFTSCPRFEDRTHTVTYITFNSNYSATFMLIHLDTDDKGYKV